MISIVVALAFAAGAFSAPSAIEEFSSITKRMHQESVHDGWRSFSRDAQTLWTFLNGSPDAAIELARAKVHNGDRAGALDELDKVAAFGQSVPVIATLPDFASLRHDSKFESILTRMARNAQPQVNARRAVTLDDPNLLPEDIDYDGDTRSFFLTSVLKGEIVRVSLQGRTQTFARSPSRWPMLALKLDRQRHIVWATEVAVDGFRTVPRGDWGRSALVAFDLNSGRVVRRMEPRGRSALGDMALLPDGSVVVSDGGQGALYLASISSSHLKRVDSGDFISPQTPAYVSPEEILVPDYVRGVAILNLGTRTAHWLFMTPPNALEGIDGAYLVGRNLFVTQNGTSPANVALFSLDSSLRKIQSSVTIERGTPNLDPTHGVWVSGKFFYIANSGWNSIDEAGVLKRGVHRSAPYIMEYD